MGTARVTLGIGTVVVLLAAACVPVAVPGAGPPDTPPRGGSAEPALAISGEIVVFAAASLTDAFREVGTAFEQAHPGTRVTFNFGASSQLRAQLQQGARADVFASADQTQLDLARQDGVLVGDDAVFARNHLVIITPRDNRQGIRDVKDLAQPGLKLVTTQPAVPIGRYTERMLDRATSDPAFGADFRARVERNIVSREDNVRQVVAKVQLGEADAAVVYASDVTHPVRDHLQQVAIPDELNILASYPVARAPGANPTGGEAFVRFLLSPPAQDTLARWGFIPANGAG